MNLKRISHLSPASELEKSNILSEQLQFEFMQEIPKIDPHAATSRASKSPMTESNRRSRASKPVKGYTQALVPNELLSEVQKAGWTCWMIQHRRRIFTTRCKAFLLHCLAVIKNRLHA